MSNLGVQQKARQIVTDELTLDGNSCLLTPNSWSLAWAWTSQTPDPSNPRNTVGGHTSSASLDIMLAGGPG